MPEEKGRTLFHLPSSPTSLRLPHQLSVAKIPCWEVSVSGQGWSQTKEAKFLFSD